ncbi:MAG: hypothetical protein ACPGVK_01415 [Halocynthiibacter sp.]
MVATRKKATPSSNQRTRRTLGQLLLRSTGIACLILGGIVIGLIWAMHVAPFRGETFDPVRWKAAGSCKGLSAKECNAQNILCPRGAMVRDIIKNHIPAQSTKRADVIDRLGKPTGHVNIKGQSCTAYTLGMCGGMGVDFDSLFVCFNDANIVSRTGRIQH